MTTPNPTTDTFSTPRQMPTNDITATSSPPRPRPRPDLVPEAPQGTGETTSSPVPPPYGGDEVNEPSTGRPDHLVPHLVPRRSCTVCGCTDNNACLDTLDEPCWWVSPDLCSACR